MKHVSRSPKKLFRN